MFIQEATKPGELNGSTPSVELGTSSIHDAYLMEFEINATNETGSSVTPTIADFLGAINQIKIQSDNSKDHYALTGMDVARRNAMFSPMGIESRVIDKTFSAVADDGTVSAKFVLTLDEGDIVALQHNNITMKVEMASTIKTDFPITSYTVKPTVIEKIPQTEQDIIGTYGENFEYALEPKVYATTKTLSNTTEYTGFLEVPTGALLRGAMLNWTSAPKQWGVVQIVPSRTEISRMNWLTSQVKDQRRFGTQLASNTVYFDYDSEWTLNGLGKDGRTFNRGDYMFAALPNNADTTLRMVSYEQMFPAGAGDILNAGKRFV